MRIYVKVIPKSSQNKVERISEGDYKAWLTAPPVAGKANESLINLLAVYFGVAKYQVSIVGGKTSRKKIVDIESI